MMWDYRRPLNHCTALCSRCYLIVIRLYTMTSPMSISCILSVRHWVYPWQRWPYNTNRAEYRSPKWQYRSRMFTNWSSTQQIEVNSLWSMKTAHYKRQYISYSSRIRVNIHIRINCGFVQNVSRELWVFFYKCRWSEYGMECKETMRWCVRYNSNESL